MSRSIASRSLRWLLALPLLALMLVAATTADEAKDKAKPKRVEEEDDAPAKGKEKAKPKREEEEETPKASQKKVIRVDEDEDPPSREKPRVAPGAGFNLRQAAREAKHGGVRQLFLELADPHDRVYLANRSERIETIPTYLDEDVRPRDPTSIVELDAQGKPTKPYVLQPSSLKKIVPYERIVLQATANFLDIHLERGGEASPRYLSRYEQLQAAEVVLGAAMRFHESARESGRRKGEAWDRVESELRKVLLEIMVEQLDVLVDAGDWDNAFALTSRLAATYPGLEDQKAIAKPVGKLLKQALNKGVYTEDKLRDIRQRLRQLEEQFPNSEAIRPITESLRRQAEDLFKRAKELAKDKANVNAAQELLKQAEDTYPSLPGLRDFQLNLNRAHPVLRVGVRHLPKYLSPAHASTDVERQAVELIFEGLVKVGPDALGSPRYHRGLTEGRPRVIGLGRRFYLPPNACWSSGTQVSATNVRESVDLLKTGPATGRSPEWGELLENVYVTGDPNRVDVHLRQGYLDPLAAMTFKIVRRDSNSEKDPEKVPFALKPEGSGPYQYVGIQPGPGGQSFAGFVANPYYGSRQQTVGLPRIREIRFISTDNPLADFAAGRIDVALDMTTDQFAKLRVQAMANRVTIPLPGVNRTNRRVYFLAVNHRQTPLDKFEVRQVLAHAIDREKLLDEFFRGGLGRHEVHKAINSPYPAGSWPLDPRIKSKAGGDSLDLHDIDLAKAKAAQIKTLLKNAHLTLKYPNNDPDVAKAMDALRNQVRDACSHDLIEPIAVEPWELKQDVEVTQNYQLAYWHYDFPDETLWLMPLLGGRGPMGTGNILNFNGDLQLLQKMTGSRDFAQVREMARNFHGQLVKELLPLIPLWQLDPFHAIHQIVKPAPYDPHLIFADAEEWRLAR